MPQIKRIISNYLEWTCGFRGQRMDFIGVKILCAWNLILKLDFSWARNSLEFEGQLNAELNPVQIRLLVTLPICLCQVQVHLSSRRLFISWPPRLLATQTLY